MTAVRQPISGRSAANAALSAPRAGGSLSPHSSEEGKVGKERRLGAQKKCFISGRPGRPHPPLERHSRPCPPAKPPAGAARPSPPPPAPPRHRSLSLHCPLLHPPLPPPHPLAAAAAAAAAAAVVAAAAALVAAAAAPPAGRRPRAAAVLRTLPPGCRLLGLFHSPRRRGRRLRRPLPLHRPRRGHQPLALAPSRPAAWPPPPAPQLRLAQPALGAGPRRAAAAWRSQSR